MNQAKIKSMRGYRRPWHISGKPSIASPSRLQQQFTIDQPDAAWVTDNYLFNELVTSHKRLQIA